MTNVIDKLINQEAIFQVDESAGWLEAELPNGESLVIARTANTSKTDILREIAEVLNCYKQV